jgi:3-oxoacyl-[acyl-carrier protein] reductase
MTGVEGRRALVTGAGSEQGIGFATALILARQGARVAITSTTKRIFDRLDELPRHDGHAAFVADLANAKAADQLVAKATKALGGIDILVNNAGMVQTGVSQKSSYLHRISDAEWARSIELNLNIAFRTTRAVLPAMMRRRHGRIVHISSITGPLVSNPRSAGYSAGKAAMTGMMRALALEVAAKGITVNSVGPGWVATASQTSGEVVAGRHTPIGRSATGAEIGHVAAFLASDEASYVTGQLIVVDGGNSIQENKGPPKGYY